MGLARLLLPRLVMLSLVLAAIAFPGGESRGQDQAFVGSIQDLPLMPGLTEIEEAGLVFDKPDGRIVEAYARGPVEAQAVRSFYRDTLPQLGWRAVGTGLFVRENEQLELQILPEAPPLTVRFILRPQ